MDTLVLKLGLTPALVGAVSLAGRRWGPAVSGWLVGLPLTSGPVALLLALDHGRSFAAAAAVGTMLGVVSQAAFGLAYAWAGARGGWPAAVAAGSLAFAAATVALRPLTLPPGRLYLLVALALAVSLRLMPGRRDAARAVGPAATPRWDLPARIAAATAFVFLLTGLAPALGPRLTGLLSPFPIYAAVLAVFAHRLDGPAAAASVMRGLLFGLFAFAAFFLVLAVALEPAGVAPAFAAATAATLGLQGVTLWLLRLADSRSVPPAALHAGKLRGPAERPRGGP